MSEAEFYVERERLLDDLDAARDAFHDDPTAETSQEFTDARNAYSMFRSQMRVLAYLGRPEDDPYRVDAERLVARGDYDQEA